MKLRRNALIIAGYGLFLLVGTNMSAGLAEELHHLPVPGMVIYPGQMLQDDMFVDAQIAGLLPVGAIDTRAQLLGRVARRTLLPGQPVTKAAIGEAKIIVNGARVPVVYQDGGLSIVTYATALQSSAVGETVSVRNLDSGRTISGVLMLLRFLPVLRRPMLAMIALACPALVSPVMVSSAQAEVRLKDVTSIRGVRDNQLIGYGLIVGLTGTGDSLRNAPFTDQAMQSMLDHVGVNVRGANLRARNVAGVMVTADLPSGAARGTRVDITISAIGDATSLQGGTLIMTPLQGADGEVHAVAQGSIAISGFASQGQAEVVTQGVPTVGRIANGAIVEKEVPNNFGTARSLMLDLKNPDFKTAIHVADAINAYAAQHYHMKSAFESDYHAVAVTIPPGVGPVRYMAEIGDLMIQPDMTARVVVDERTGTIVIGQDVTISTVAVTHGNLTVRVTEKPQVSQPNAKSLGKTVVVPNTEVDVMQDGGRLGILRGVNLQSLVRGLNQIGLKPMDIIAILQAIKTAGALQAELVVQ
eukprot:gene7299-7370_t